MPPTLKVKCARPSGWAGGPGCSGHQAGRGLKPHVTAEWSTPQDLHAGSCASILLPFWHEVQVIYSSCPLAGCPPPRLRVTGRLAGSLGGRRRRRAQQRTRRQRPSQRRRLAHRYPRAGSARTIKLGGVSAASALSLPVNRNRPARSPSRRPADSGPEHPLHSATRELEAAGVEFRFASRVGPPHVATGTLGCSQ